MIFMAKKSVLQGAVPDEVKHTVLREAVIRYQNELMGDEERSLLEDRIKWLRQQLGLVGTM
jgi:hypothetical protein